LGSVFVFVFVSRHASGVKQTYEQMAAKALTPKQKQMIEVKKIKIK
jgi:hypothetical protein